MSFLHRQYTCKPASCRCQNCISNIDRCFICNINPLILFQTVQLLVFTASHRSLSFNMSLIVERAIDYHLLADQTFHKSCLHTAFHTNPMPL
ncbi:hypothetical protein L211DRAFT_370152 [Terfezia boudieri ATCC MYA-4762]|uniref:Uncharacterized protein n=1 Tax=Terfezia boudieri ATCC MYA-4762 TaxID=1051890 RepID=A0A3N4M694_9PEZI|nr:hypothetical protein L211DRAFT_370152 [Terfezia boudieri ATCC MYA-4762]